MTIHDAVQRCDRFVQQLDVEVEPVPFAIKYVKSSHRISLLRNPGAAWLVKYNYVNVDPNFPHRELSLYVDILTGNVEIVPSM